MAEWIVATYRSLLIFAVWVGVAVWAALGAIIGRGMAGHDGMVMGVVLGAGAGLLISAVFVGFFLEVAEIHRLLLRIEQGAGSSLQPAAPARPPLPVAPPAEAARNVVVAEAPADLSAPYWTPKLLALREQLVRAGYELARDSDAWAVSNSSQKARYRTEEELQMAANRVSAGYALT